MKLSDRLIAAIAVAGGCAIIAGTFGFREVPGQQFGSAFFPRVTGAATILVGFAQIAVAQGGPTLVPPVWMRTRGAWSALGVVAAVVAWLLAAPLLGFLLTTALMIGLLSLLLGGRPLTAFAVGAGGAVGFHLIFVTLLRVPLPRGLIEAALP